MGKLELPHPQLKKLEYSPYFFLLKEAGRFALFNVPALTPMTPIPARFHFPVDEWKKKMITYGKRPSVKRKKKLAYPQTRSKK
jgi:hypothetical protein